MAQRVGFLFLLVAPRTRVSWLSVVSFLAWRSPPTPTCKFSRMPELQGAFSRIRSTWDPPQRLPSGLLNGSGFSGSGGTPTATAQLTPKMRACSTRKRPIRCCAVAQRQRRTLTATEFQIVWTRALTTQTTRVLGRVVAPINRTCSVLESPASSRLAVAAAKKQPATRKGNAARPTAHRFLGEAALTRCLGTAFTGSATAPRLGTMPTVSAMPSPGVR